MVSLPQEAERGWIPLRFDAGVGAYRARFQDAKSRFSRLHTFVPGQITLPLKTTASAAPALLSGLKTDYASMIETYIGGAWKIVLVRGTHPYVATGDSFVPATTPTVALAEGRQLIDATIGYFGITKVRYLFWLAGANANVQYSTAGTTWADWGTQNKQKGLCGWNIADYGDNWALVIVCSDGTLAYTTNESIGFLPMNFANAFIAATSSGVVPLGPLEDCRRVYIANGPAIWEHDCTDVALTAVQASQRFWRHETGLRDVSAGCRIEDEFAITDGWRILRWHPSRPARDISIWANNCPPGMEGKVKSLQALGEYLLAYYEFDALGTMVFMGRPTRQGMDWHPVATGLSGEFPSSIGSPFLVSEKTVSGRRRLWTCTADGTTGYLYRQDWPAPSFNPLDDPTLEYEDGWLYLYSPWYDLIEAGDFVAELTRAAVVADISTTEQIKVEYRPGPDLTAEEGATWLEGATFADPTTQIQELVAERPSPVFIQFRLGMERGGSATLTPILYNLFVSARERQSASGLGIR